MKNKKAKIVSIIAIIALVLTVITATYAYFQAHTGEGSQADVKINANTVDTLTFETGGAISLSLEQENFAQGAGNQMGSTFAKAVLTANNKTNSATEHYYMYLNISNNSFVYTQNESTPEILLTIKDESNNEITSISGLTYKTVPDASGVSITGFDITTKSGLITIFDNREITTTSSKIEQWNVIVTYVNYDADQSANAGKNFSAKLEIQKDEYNQTLADYVISQFTGTQGENTIYFHDLTLANGASDNSYRYAGPSEEVNNFVCFGSTESPCPTDNLYRIIGVIDGKVKLIKAAIATSNLLGTNGGYYSDTTYKWSNLSSCPSDTSAYINNKKVLKIANKNIIGAGDIGFGCNIWKYSGLNANNLNVDYLNNIGSKWSNMIEDTTWKVSGHSTSNVTAHDMYVAEITNATQTYGPSVGVSKIGLMYASDYGFAANPSAWTTTLGSYYDSSIASVNWLSGINEWIISPYSLSDDKVFYLNSDGFVNNGGADNLHTIRPVFYLKSSAGYAGGNGTKNSPFRLS